MDTVPQGFKEPCFLILPVSIGQSRLLENRYRRTHLFDVHYFSGKNQDLYTVAEQLSTALEWINLKTGPVMGTGMNFRIIDGVLHFMVNYNLYVRKWEINETTGEIIRNEDRMTELKTNLEVI